MCDMSEYEFEKYGNFVEGGREFRIHRFDTPKLWNNYAWNSQLLSRIDQRGRGDSMFRNAEGHRITLVQDRLLYVKQSGVEGGTYSHGWLRDDEVERFCHHGLGYSRLTSKYAGIEVEATTTVAMDAPVELWQIKVRNNSSETKDVAIYPTVEFDMDTPEAYGGIENYIKGAFLDDTFYIENNCAPESPTPSHCFFTGSRIPQSFELSKNRFTGGIYDSIENPQALHSESLSSRDSANESLVGVMQFEFKLEPGGEEVLFLALGPYADSRDLVSQYRETFLNAAGFAEELKKQDASRDALFNMDFELKDEYLTNLFNIWAKNELLMLCDYSRAWTMGFRDLMQDSKGICSYRPDITRRSILLASRHQMQDGFCLRGWWPVDDKKYTDSILWMVYTVCEYIKETGEFSILDETVPYYDGGEGSLFDHILQGLKWVYANPGPHELTRSYFGDWNDSLGIGRKGMGESVWLSIAFVKALDEFNELLSKTKYSEHCEYCQETRGRVVSAIEQHCWDGEWYIRGFADNGDLVGSKSSEEGKIFANPQIWAILANIDPAKNDQLMDVVDKHLDSDFGTVTLTPAYTRYDDAMGRLSTIPSGWGENCSIYCHVTAFRAVAECMIGRSNDALRSIKKIIAINPLNPIDNSGCEPYGFTNLYNGLGHPRPGVSLRGWWTGTIPWVLHAVTQGMLGIRPTYDGLLIAPELPDEWPEATVKRKFRDACYKISITNTGGPYRIFVDGEEIEGNVVAYEKYNGEHIIEVR